MRREINRIEPWSAVRIGFFTGLLGGFVIGLLNGAIIRYFAGVLGEKVLPPDLMSVANLSGGAIVALAIIMSLMLSLMLAVLGLAAALCYNLIARLFGGLEIHVTGDDTSRAGASSNAQQDDEEPEHE